MCAAIWQYDGPGLWQKMTESVGASRVCVSAHIPPPKPKPIPLGSAESSVSSLARYAEELALSTLLPPSGPTVVLELCSFSFTFRRSHLDARAYIHIAWKRN